MKRYLSQIHTKPEAHKKRFALLVSGGFTLLIFAIWSVVMFGGEAQVAKEAAGPVNLAAVSQSGITPFENLLEGIRDAWGSIIDLITHDK